MTSFLRLLDLSDEGPDRFRAACPQQQAPRLFGGQVAAQALCAACRTAPDGRPPHSLHAYFLRPGRPGAPVQLEVTRSRDGRSFATRLVTASQSDQVIFVMMVSFHSGEDGPDWQALPRPEAPGPDAVTPAEPPLAWFGAVASFDIRPARAAGGVAPLHPCWVRSRERLPDDPVAHACALAFMSDIGMVRAARTPGSAHRPLSGASLDHALWLHRPARADQWLLFSAAATTNAGARGLASGTLHTDDGVLVASVSQEAILRPSGSFPLT